MSALQTLRNKAGLLIAIVIGLALLAFILTDLLQSGKSMISGQTNVVAEIDGSGIAYDKYTDLLSRIEENHKNQNGTNIDERTKIKFKSEAWDEIVEEAIYNQEFEKLGLGISHKGGAPTISSAELEDMVLGNNISPLIQQYFTNRETGIYDKNAALNFIQNMGQNQEQKEAWIQLEKVLMTNRLRTKYSALISKGLYVTNKEAEFTANNKNRKVDFQYISLKYRTIADSSISISDNEIEEYLSAHKNEFDSEEMVDIEYVTFDILPSDKDFEATEKWLSDNASDFQLTDNDEQFVRSNSDISYDYKYYAPGELSERLDTFAFQSSAKAGDITNVYFEDDYYKVSKISRFEMIPDSVHARHILLKSKNAMVQADSLMELLNNGADFAMLALNNSEGPTATKGGDLGWFKEGAMVKPFNDTCFLGETGKYYQVISQFGVHVVEILEQSAKTKKVQIATLASKVIPSTVTRNTIYSKAGQFANQNLTREQFLAAISSEVTGDKKIANDLKKSSYTIPGLQNSRQIIRWAFETDINSVSGVFECEDEFVVATIKNKTDEGEISTESVSDEIKTEIAKTKKAEILANKIEEAGEYNSLPELAEKLELNIENASGITFSSVSVPGLGVEPEVIGLATSIEARTLSPIIKGEYGVYIISATNVTDSGTANLEMEQQQQMRSLKSRFEYNLAKILKEASDITDNRITFE